jgi:hypothetical protein
MGLSERSKEIKRRRHRKVKLAQLKRRSEKASPSARAMIAEKIRKLTPGSETIIANWGLEDR